MSLISKPTNQIISLKLKELLNKKIIYNFKILDKNFILLEIGKFYNKINKKIEK